MIQCLTNTLEPVDMANVHKHLSNLWALDEINYKYTDNNPHKKQKNSMMDSAMESKINNNVKSNSNFPRMTRAGSKILMNRMQSNVGSSNSNWIQANPMGTDYAASQYN